MKALWVGALALLASTGCVVRHHHHHGPPPPPPPPPPAHSTVTVHVGWTHVRYSIWAEYYGCSDEEIYYLENCGYDDDDLLVLCYIARRARVPIRSVLWDYDRCGRSLYTVSLVYRLDPFAFYCADVPRFYRCPPVYARAYGYYWRGERPYLTNDECHALVHLQIGIRYYGYSHVQYFEHHERGVQRADRHVFRTIVVRDHPRCGSGGKNVHETVIVKRDRAWEHRDIKEWEKKRDVVREQVKVRHTPEHERQENEKAKKAAEAEDRRRAFEEARQRAEVARREREESDKRHPNENRPADPGPKRPDDKDAGRVPPPNDGPARRNPPGPEKKDVAGPPGRPNLDDDRKGPPDRPKPDEEGRGKGPSNPEPKGPGRAQDDDRKGPPSKVEDAPRGPEKAPPRKTEDAPRGPEKAPPPPKADDAPRGPEKAPPPQKRSDDNRQPPPPPRKAEEAPRGPEKAPPPPPPPPKRSEDNRKPPPPPPQKSEERKGPEKPPPKSDDSKKGSGKEKGGPRSR